MIGGTYLVVRDIEVDPSWHALDEAAQERIIGRDKHTGAPLGGTRLFEKPHLETPARGRPHPPGVTADQRRDDPPPRLRHAARPPLPRLHEGSAPPVRPAAAQPERPRRPPRAHDGPRQRRVRRAEKSHCCTLNDRVSPSHPLLRPRLPVGLVGLPRHRRSPVALWRPARLAQRHDRPDRERRVYEQRGYTPAGQARGYRTFRERGMPFATEPREKRPRHVADVPRRRRHPPPRPRARVRRLPRAAVRAVHEHRLPRGRRSSCATRSRGCPASTPTRSSRPRTTPRPRRCSSRTATRPAPPRARPTEFQDKHANTDGRVRYTAPSIRFTNEQGVTLEAGGFQSFEAYDVLVANLDQSLEPPRARRGRRRGPAGVPGRSDDRRGRADHDRGQVHARPQQGRGLADRRDRRRRRARACRSGTTRCGSRARRSRSPRRPRTQRRGAARKAAPPRHLLRSRRRQREGQRLACTCPYGARRWT